MIVDVFLEDGGHLVWKVPPPRHTHAAQRTVSKQRAAGGKRYRRGWKHR